MVCPNYRGEKLYEVAPVVCDANLVTASGIAPLEFTREVLEMLDVFAPDTLKAWYSPHKTYNSEYFFEIMQSLNS